MAAKFGPNGATMVGAAGVYALTSFLVLRLPHPHVPPRRGEVSKLGRLPELRVAAAGVVGLRVATGFLIFLLGFASRRAEAPLWWFGLLIAAATVGLYAGDFLAPRLPARLREEGIVLISLIAAGIGGLIAFSVFGIPALVVFCLLAGMSGEFGRLALQSLAQRYVPERAHGRVFVRYEVVFQLAWVAGALIPSLIEIPFQTGILLMGAFYLMVAGLFVARPLVAERTERKRSESREGPLIG
jgi:MFS family permease